MIVSVSRRTDIPAAYADWFFRRLREGYVCVRNPLNPHQLSKISLAPADVDGFVFWTKNPMPMMDRLSLLSAYPYYFQFTLTSAGRDVETNLPSKSEVLIPAFRELGKRLGRHRVIWRYDPIFLGGTYTVEYHIRYFEKLAERLAEATEKCTLSFLDLYKNTRKNASDIRTPNGDEIHVLLEAFSETAKRVGITLDTCGEDMDLSRYGITHASCIDADRLSRIAGYTISVQPDPNQRKACHCDQAVDIGVYNTCPNGCRYCYANYISSLVSQNRESHDPHSPLLVGHLTAEDRVTERGRNKQMKLR